MNSQQEKRREALEKIEMFQFEGWVSTRIGFQGDDFIVFNPQTGDAVKLTALQGSRSGQIKVESPGITIVCNKRTLQNAFKHVAEWADVQ